MTPSPASSSDSPVRASEDARADAAGEGARPATGVAEQGRDGAAAHSSRRGALRVAGMLAAGTIGAAAGAAATHWHDGRRSPTFRVAALPADGSGRRAVSTTFRVAPGTGSVALTFDDGPDPRWTPVVLDMLSRLGVKATFFVLGEAARAHPDLIAREAAEGHEVAIHNWVHTDVYGASPDELGRDIDRTIEAITSAGAPKPTLWRPPYGRVDAVALAAAADRGLDLVLWSLHTPGAAAAKEVGQAAQDGAIILCHDGRSQPYAELMEEMGRSVERIQSRGLRVVSAGELLAGGGGS
ncbi:MULTISPECIES: polysaccharide deacetylase family protein [Actinomyces]|uniref:Polysaccharide deacetylase family protein n=1 Tax=Actinomyces marmotae TaxID=2737173 RepID=A0A6M8B7C9_9ACTO|nr:MULTISPECIES: polysaccharide deacetylase family protein [Actinomyces]QKD79976.1 polysaccharide deacetylase family protein [Actinomyces marmotae]